MAFNREKYRTIRVAPNKVDSKSVESSLSKKTKSGDNEEPLNNEHNRKTLVTDDSQKNRLNKIRARTKPNSFVETKKFDLDLGRLYYEVSYEHRKEWEKLFKEITGLDWSFTNIGKLTLPQKRHFFKQWKARAVELGISKHDKGSSLGMSDVEFDKMNTESKIMYNDELKYPPIVLYIQDKIWGTLGSISIVMGAAKSRKTFLISVAVSAALSKKIIIGKITGSLPIDKKKVWYFDTEQAEYNVVKVAKRIAEMVHNNTAIEDNLEIRKIRGYNTKTRLAFIDKVIMEKSDGVGLVIIDGVRDLLDDINSPQQATMISDFLLRWTEKGNIHVIAALHSNKTDKNLRGHIGTEMLNKAETVISVEKSENDKEISIVTCREGRHIDFEDFAFRIDENGLPVEVKDIPVSDKKPGRKSIEFDDYLGKHKEILEIIFSRNDEYSRGDFSTKVKLEFADKAISIGNSKAEEWVSIYENRGWINIKKVGKSKIVSRV